MAAAVQTSPAGFTYSGNPDFRGYLAANAPQYLGAVGGDYQGQGTTGLNVSALQGMVPAGQNSETAGQNAYQPQVNAIQQAYQTYANDVSGLGAKSGGTTTGGTTTGTLSPAEINAALASIAGQQQTYQNSYNTAAAANAGTDAQNTLNENTDLQNNTTARSTAIQNADQAAAQGNQGLRAVLASLGALNGTGQVLAGRAVANSANGDIGTADNTYTTNNEAIQSAIATALSQKNARDAALQDSLATDNRNATLSGDQTIVSEAQNAGDTATANTYLGKLAGATPAATSIVASPVLYNGANTAAYAPTSSQTVTASQPSAAAANAAVTPVNSALYATKTNS